MFGISSSSVASHQSLATTFLKDGGQPSKTEFPRVKGKCGHLLHQYLTPCANVVVISNSGINPPTQKDLVQGPPLVFTLGLNPSVTRIGRRKRRADHWQNESSRWPPQNCARADLTAAENEVSAGRLWPCAATGLGSPLQKRVAASRGKLKSLEDQRVEEETTSDSSRRGTSR